MSIADNLIADETVIFATTKHWAAPIRDSVWGVLLLIGAFLIGWISPDAEGGLFGAISRFLDIIRTALVIFGLGQIIYNVLVWRSSAFAVTNLRVIRDEGFISKRTSTTLLNSVSDVQTRIGFIGARLGYGDILIFTQSGRAGRDRFTTITHPTEFRNALMAQKMGAATAAAGAEAAVTKRAAAAAVTAPAGAAPAAASSGAEAADALSRLADLRDRGAITPAEYDAKKTEILARI